MLIDWDPRHLYRQLIDDEAEMEHFLTHVCSPAWNEAQDAGRSWADATALLIDEHPQYDTLIRAFYQRWEEMLAGPVPSTVDLLHRLREQGRYGLFALTNWSAETWPVAWERYDFLRWFEGILVSGQEKMRKPEERFYRLLEERFPLSLSTSLFIDDNLRNVEHARVLGLRSVHFKPGMDLEQAIGAYGVAVDPL
ncbi:MAG: HAD-IA family hydrolase [Lewinella sp.]|nr:HAD-IA family hydrolase [Lewinella sp.]